MYKIIFLLNKTGDEDINNHFKEYTLKNISALAGEEVPAGTVESNLLLDQKYSLMCELSAPSKEEMDIKMNSAEGKALNKELMNFHQHLTIIAVNYK
jgi:hypothetical protein